MIEYDQYINAQVSVLGSVIIDDRCAARVIHRTREEDYTTSYRSIFRAMKKLFAANRPIDPTTLFGVLGTDYGKLLREIAELTPTAANVDAYIDLLLEEAKRTRLMELGELLAQRPPAEECDAIVQRIARVSGDRPSVQVVSMANGIADFYQRQKTKPEFLPWGIDALDETVMTELGGDFNVLGGYPSSGKTALSLQMAWTQAKTLRVGYFSLETKPEKVIDRTVAMVTGVDFKRIKRHRLEDEDWKVFGQMLKPMAERKLEIIKAGGLTVAEIQALTLAGRYQVIYIDYLQLIRGGNPRDNDTSRVTQISMDLHTMAQNMGVTIVALSQLSRPDDANTPTMHSLRQSGQIEQDADAILLLYKTYPNADKKDPEYRLRELKVAKNKEGESGGVMTLMFRGDIQRFVPVQEDKSKEIAGKLSRQGRATKRANQIKQMEFSDLPADTELPPEFEEGSQC